MAQNYHAIMDALDTTMPGLSLCHELTFPPQNGRGPYSLSGCELPNPPELPEGRDFDFNGKVHGTWKFAIYGYDMKWTFLRVEYFCFALVWAWFYFVTVNKRFGRRK